MTEEAGAFWERLGALPAGVTAQDRARELCAVVYSNDQLVAVSTAVIRRLESVRANFAFYRALVDPAFRRQHIAQRLRAFSWDVLSEWSREHPAEQVKGLAAVVQTPLYKDFRKKPVWADGFAVVGYTDQGEQVRVRWFAHARVE